MNYLEKFLKTLLIASLLMPLIAQESEDEDEGLEVVVTTATKTEKDILDTAQAVTALSGNQLLELGLNNIKDLNNMEIIGEKSKFMYEKIRYKVKITNSINIVFFPKGFILKVN